MEEEKIKELEEKINDIEKEEFNARRWYTEDYLLDVLNWEKTIEELREDLLSFRNTEYYTWTRDIYKEEAIE